MSNGRVQVFDSRGGFLRTIGRSGQGPGEFEYPTLIRFGGRERYVHMRRQVPGRINSFHSAGVYVRSIVAEGGFKDYFPDEGDGFVAVSWTSSDEDLINLLALNRLDRDGKTKAILARFPYTIYMEKSGGGTLSFRRSFELSLYVAPLPGNALVYGYSGDYELVVLGPDDLRKKLLSSGRTSRSPNSLPRKRKPSFGGSPFRS